MKVVGEMRKKKKVGVLVRDRERYLLATHFISQSS